MDLNMCGSVSMSAACAPRRQIYVLKMALHVQLYYAYLLHICDDMVLSGSAQVQCMTIRAMPLSNQLKNLEGRDNVCDAHLRTLTSGMMGLLGVHFLKCELAGFGSALYGVKWAALCNF